MNDRKFLSVIFALLIVSGAVGLILIDPGETRYQEERLIVALADIKAFNRSISNQIEANTPDFSQLASALNFITRQLKNFESDGGLSEALETLEAEVSEISEQLRTEQALRQESMVRMEAQLEIFRERLKESADKDSSYQDRIVNNLTSIIALATGFIGLVLTIRKSDPEIELLKLQAEKIRVEVENLRRPSNSSNKPRAQQVLPADAEDGAAEG